MKKLLLSLCLIFVATNAVALIDLNNPKTAILCAGVDNETQKNLLVEFWPTYGEIYKYLETDPNGEDVGSTDSTSVDFVGLEGVPFSPKEKVSEELGFVSFPWKNQYRFIHEEGDVVATFTEEEGSDELSGLYYEGAELSECIIIDDARL